MMMIHINKLINAHNCTSSNKSVMCFRNSLQVGSPWPIRQEFRNLESPNVPNKKSTLVKALDSPIAIAPNSFDPLTVQLELAITCGLSSPSTRGEKTGAARLVILWLNSLVKFIQMIYPMKHPIKKISYPFAIYNPIINDTIKR